MARCSPSADSRSTWRKRSRWPAARATCCSCRWRRAGTSVDRLWPWESSSAEWPSLTALNRALCRVASAATRSGGSFASPVGAGRKCAGGLTPSSRPTKRCTPPFAAQQTPSRRAFARRGMTDWAAALIRGVSFAASSGEIWSPSWIGKALRRMSTSMVPWPKKSMVAKGRACIIGFGAGVCADAPLAAASASSNAKPFITPSA